MERCYCLNKDTIAIYAGNKRKPACILIPQNAIIMAVDGFTEQDRLVDVEWNHLPVKIFVVDLRERGTLIRRAAASR